MGIAGRAVRAGAAILAAALLPAGCSAPPDPCSGPRPVAVSIERNRPFRLPGSRPAEV